MRGLPNGLLSFALVLATAAPGAAVGQSRIELYRRVVPLEATTGVTSIRETVARQIDVPAECEDGSMECTEMRRFARVWRIDFGVETQTNTGEETVVVLEDRGTVWLALAAERDDEEDYAAHLRDALARLGAAAFDEPHAGLRPDRRPFDGDVAARSTEASWACFEYGDSTSATRYRREVTVADDGTVHVNGTSSSTHDEEEITGRLCAALDEATAAAHAEVIRTMSTPRLLLEDVLRVEVSDSLPARLHGDELVALPEGAWLARKSVPGVSRSTGLSRRDDVIESRVAIEEVEISARIMPASLPTAAARSNVWHSRWTLETVERRLGPLPATRVLDSWSITASLMPTVPPEDLDQGGEPGSVIADPDEAYPVRLDQQAMFDSVATSLDFRAEVSPDVLADLIVRKITGLDSPGWILVLCRPDIEATWGVAPPAGRSRLLNGDEFCGTVAAYLPGL